jgi:type I restriction enzyme S subunit
MQSDWRSARLAELGRIVTGKTPPTAVEGCFGGSTLFVTPSDYDGTKYIRRTTRKLTARGEQAISSARLPPNAVMVTCIGSDMGKTALNATEAFTNQQINSLIVESGDLPEYVYYNLSMRKNELRARASGSAQPILNKSAFGATELELPTLGVQAAIVEALKALDDRIDLLRETNATLEAIAQTLFKSWFIDFDPVRAKAEGREPEGMDAATAALFPAEFEESALGLIPRGWHASTLAEHISAERGLSYKGAGLCSQGDGLPMHNLNSVLEGGGYKYAGIKHYSGDFKDRHLAVTGDVIVANTEQGHDHRLIGFPAIVPARYETAIYSHHLYRLRLKRESTLTTHSLYYMLMTPNVREQIIGCANGSTVNMLKVAGLEIPRFVCPPKKVAQAFQAVVEPLWRQIEANVERSGSLTQLRDTLLPRLISGKLRLLDAEADIEAVA